MKNGEQLTPLDHWMVIKNIYVYKSRMAEKYMDWMKD